MDEEKRVKAVVFMADGFEEIEAVTVIDILRRADINTYAVSITNSYQVTGAHGIKITCDRIICDTIDNPDIVILPGGGEGTRNLKSSSIITDLLVKYNSEKKWLAAICAAPTVFEHVGILKGRTAVCFPACEAEIKTAVIGSNDVEVSDNIITSKAAGTTAAFALKMVELVKDNAVAEELRKAMMY